VFLEFFLGIHEFSLSSLCGPSKDSSTDRHEVGHDVADLPLAPLVNLSAFPFVFTEESSVSVSKILSDSNAFVDAAFRSLEERELSSHVDVLVFSGSALFFRQDLHLNGVSSSVRDGDAVENHRVPGVVGVNSGHLFNYL